MDSGPLRQRSRWRKTQLRPPSYDALHELSTGRSKLKRSNFVALKLADNMTQYCSQECLKDHSHVHEAYCNDPLRTESFLPEFCGEDQSPADYIFPGAAQLDIAQLWGTNRAMDVLNLQNNEGEDFQQPLTVFFASKSPFKLCELC